MSQNNTNHLFLVRHGENLVNLTYEFSHRRVDYSLTPKGELQASQTAVYLRDKGIQEVYASPLKRAVETAAIIAGPLGLPVTTIENFRELNVGDMENQPPTAELWAQHNAIIGAWFGGRPEERFPGGEDYHTITARGAAGLREVIAGKSGRKILIVAHGGILIFTLLALLSDVDLGQLMKGMANCAVTEIEAKLVDEQLSLKILSYPSAAHLSGEAADLVSGVLDTSGEGD